MSFRPIALPMLLAALLLSLAGRVALAQTTAFTYQGRLTENGTPANGPFQLQFKLFDSLGGAGQVGSTVSDVPVTVDQGLFTVLLDFGANALSGANRWLELGVRHNSGESYSTLSPREQIASSPYAVRTLSAASADTLSAACSGCVQDSQIDAVSGAKVTGTVANASSAGDAANLGGISAANYVTTSGLSTATIRNQSTLQSPASFNISGSGFVGGSLGVGTTGPSSALDVRGNLTLDPGIGPAIFTAASGGEQNRFLALLNSPAFQSASGLKAGGVLVSDSYGFANPGKSDLVVKGNIAIGTPTTSASRIEIAAQDGLRVTGYQPFITLRDGATNAYLRSVGGNLTVLNSNLSQTAHVSGLLKFGMLINANGTINLCYYPQNPSNCGISVNHFQTGYYDITFPQQINTRIFSVTLALPPALNQQNIDVVMVRPYNTNTIRVRLSYYGPGVNDADADFYLTVF